MQGDSYDLPFKIKANNGDILTDNEITEIEFVLGALTKSLSSGEIKFDAVNNEFYFRFSQEETMRLIGELVPQVRVKVNEAEEVIGNKLDTIKFIHSSSKKVI